MKETKLKRIIIEEDVICDYCDIPILAGEEAFIRTIKYDNEGYFDIILCSSNCLDEYEAEEFENELENGLHETSEDYFKDYIDFDDLNGEE